MKLSKNNLSLRERVSLKLSKNWKVAVTILALAIAAMIGILAADITAKNKRSASAELAEDIQEKYADWVEKEPNDRTDDEIMALIDQALTEYPRYFAAARALFIRARMNYEKKNWVEAAESFEELANNWEDSYLAPVSLFNAAGAWEQAEEIEDAKRLWTSLISRYTSPYVPEAMFNLARIAELEGHTEKALEHYGEISSRYPDSRWTDLARSRMLESGSNE